MRATKAIIDLAAIRHNLESVKQFAPGAKVMAVVKADAYGHGIVKTALSLTNADAIAVACLDEAITLREAGVQSEIVLLEGFFSVEELNLALEFNLQTVIHQQSQLEQLQIASQKCPDKNIDVWLKLDSGMNRLGFYEESFEDAVSLVQSLPVVNKVNLMSHLACADDIENDMSNRQIQQFKAVTDKYALPRSMANSAGVVAWPESHFEWTRPGIMLYGCSPMIGFTGKQHQLKPAMTLRSQLFAIHHLKAGETVGYGASWRAQKETRIGVIAIGYGDGYPRHAKNGTPVLIKGKKYPLVGKVSMDMITVDLGNEDTFELGETAILWGGGLAVEEVAKFADTIPYTLLCSVTSRVKFEWIND